MSLAGLDWQVIQFPFAKGLDTKTHPFAVDPPSLVLCYNAQFDDLGALTMRMGYAGIGANIYGGGSIANPRKLAVVGDELLLWTDTGLYSWSETLTAWVSRGTHLAVKVDEAAVFGGTADQVFADRAQLGGVVVYVWEESSTGVCRLAARDATTGATLIAPTSLGAGTTRPRVIATDSQIFVLWVSAGTGLVVSTITPSAPTFSGGILALVDASEKNYDAVRHPTADQIVVLTHAALGTSYTVSKVTTAGAITSSTKARAADTDEPIALACAASTTDRVQVFRIDRSGGTDYILGDLLVLSTLADVYTGQTIGDVTSSTVDQLTAAFRSTTDGGFYRCYAFWSVDEAQATDDVHSAVWSNWTNTNNAQGTAAVLAYRLGLASRAFDHRGSVYAWLTFAAANNAVPHSLIGTDTILGFEVPVQSTNYLYRDDGTFHAKAANMRAGGFGYETGHLAGVALVSGSTSYATATTERGFINLGGYFNTTGYGARSPRDVTFTFDSDDARRVVVLGRTAYVSGGLVQQYDGEGLTEVGFEQAPWYIDVDDDGTAGAVKAGKYSYKAGVRWDNARGETERSTSIIGLQITVAASKKPLWVASRIRVTKKQGSRRNPALEMWRTEADPTIDAPFYLITDRDPAATGDNGYVENDAASSALHSTERDNLPDEGATFTDPSVTDRETHPETGDVLPRFAPPAASILVAGEARLFLAGIPGDPGAIVYSLLRNEGEIVGFHPALRVALPASAGAITALAIMDGALVAFTATSVYALDGTGFDNLGGGTNYGPPRLVSADIGCTSQDALAPIPGGVVFFSRKGWYRINRGWDLEYIGARVEGYNGDTWVAAQTVEAQHHVRLLSSSRMLVWDYLVNEWSEWTETGGRALAMWRTYPMLLDSLVKKQAVYNADQGWSFDVLMRIRLAGISGLARVRRVHLLTRWHDDHKLRVRLYFNDAQVATDDKTMTVENLSGGDPFELRMGPSQQRLKEIGVRVTALTVTDEPLTEAFTEFVGIALEVGLRRGLYPRLPATQQQ